MATEPVMYETRIDLGRQARLSLARLLNQRLADMIDLFNQTKHAHWNVKGPEFMQLHELFDGVAERVEEGCDLLAERVVTLGVAAEGTTRQSAAASTISEYDLAAVDGLDHVRALAGQVAKLAASIRGAIQQSAELGDPTTADLFTEISRSLDKDLWFLEAHLQKKP
jgi:starvation-inducible DNA-binding protein